MAKSYLIGVDIGTYSSKGVLVEAVSGGVVAEQVLEHELTSPNPGWMEHDPELTWWGEFTLICRRLLSSSGIDPRAVKGVGVSGIGPCALPVDENGRPLRQAILYGIDTRAGEEIEFLESKIGRQDIFSHSATHLSSSANGAKILWIKNHEPQVYARARWFLTSQTYIVLKLTGQAVMDHYTACTYAPLLDVRQRRWREDLGDLVTTSDRLPQVAWTCEVAGTVTAQAARETGLPEGTPVIAGTLDSAAEAISAGVSRFGDMMMMFGSSNSFILKTDHLAPTDAFWALNWLEPDTYAFVGGMATVGSLTRWFRDNLSPAEVAAQERTGVDAYEAIAGLLKDSPAGANGLVALPYFEGERTPMYDPDAKGVLFGLRLHHTRADIYRALLESVGYGIRHNVDGMKAESIAPRQILAVGGGTRNLAWMQMISDIAGIEMRIPAQRMGSSYGDAFLAGVGVGLFNRIDEIQHWVRYNTHLKPDPQATAFYLPRYQLYRDLYGQNRDLMKRLTGLAGA